MAEEFSAGHTSPHSRALAQLSRDDLSLLAPALPSLDRSSLPAIDPLSTAATADLLPFYVIGTDQGWYPGLQAPVTTLQMGPAERYDVIIDLSGARHTLWRAVTCCCHAVACVPCVLLLRCGVLCVLLPVLAHGVLLST